MMVEGDRDVLEVEGRATIACELDPVAPVEPVEVEPVAPSVVVDPGAPRNVELVDEEELV